MQSVTILPGRDKTGKPEPFQGITLERGELCTIVGNTGSGKSRFIKDVEQLAHGDSVTRRRVLLDGVEIPAEEVPYLQKMLIQIADDLIGLIGFDLNKFVGIFQGIVNDFYQKTGGCTTGIGFRKLPIRSIFPVKGFKFFLKIT